MKKFLFSFASIILFTAIAQAQISCPWAKKAGGIYEDGGAAIATDPQGNVYSVGYFYSATVAFGSTALHNTYGGANMYITKQDSCGNFIWAKQANGKDGGDVNALSMAVDAAGNVYVAGYNNVDTIYFGSTISVNPTGAYNAFLVKYNTSGVAQWAKQSTGNEVNIATGVAVSGSNVYLAGNFTSTTIAFGSNSAHNYTNDGFTNDAFIAAFDNNGNSLWVRASLSNGNTSGDVNVGGISADAAGNVYMAGYFNSNYIRFNNDSLANNYDNDIFLAKYDASGNYQWVRAVSGSSDDEAKAIATDASGNSYITGYLGNDSSPISFGSHSVTNTSSYAAAFIAKYDANGNDLWASCTAGDYYSFNYGRGLSLDVSGDAYMIGSYTSDQFYIGSDTLYNMSAIDGNPGDYFQDVFVAKYKANGMFSWARTAGGDSNDLGKGIATGAYKNLYITGEYQSPSISFAGITLSTSNNVGDAFIANNISTWNIAPSICLVSADSIVGTNQYNVIYWDKTPYTTVASFIIYREVSTNIYKPIGMVPYSALSEFVDTARSVGPSNGDPTIGTYRYAMQLMDNSGAFSLMSQFHNTVFFQNNLGTFSWNLYAVGDIGGSTTTTPVTNFHLMRDDSNTDNYQVIGTVSGSQITLNDPNYSVFATVANWRVDADGFNCTPTLRLANNGNSTDAAKVKSHSNSTNNRQVGIKQFADNNNQVSVYPNPANSSFVVETNLTEKQQLQVIDIAGKIVLQQIINGKTTIDTSLLNDGVYTINLIGSQNVAYKKLVIVK